MAPHVVHQSDLCLPLRHRSPPLPVAPRTGPAHRLRLLSLPFRRLAVRVSSSGSKNRGAEQQRSGLQTGFQRDSDGERLTTEVEKEEAEGRGGSGERHEGPEWNWPPWKHLPERYKLIGTTSLAFVICNMDKWPKRVVAQWCCKDEITEAATAAADAGAQRCMGRNHYCSLLEGSIDHCSRSAWGMCVGGCSVPRLEGSDAWEEIATAVFWKAVLIATADQRGMCVGCGDRGKGLHWCGRGQRREMA
ncbi:hypothetical protein GW17_00029221, partial [Ensete ventricosum]